MRTAFRVVGTTLVCPIAAAPSRVVARGQKTINGDSCTASRPPSAFGSLGAALLPIPGGHVATSFGGEQPGEHQSYFSGGVGQVDLGDPSLSNKVEVNEGESRCAREGDGAQLAGYPRQAGACLSEAEANRGDGDTNCLGQPEINLRPSDPLKRSPMEERP